MKKYVFLSVMAVSLYACKSETPTSQKQEVYFDVKGFFEDEIQQLTRNKPLVRKTVSINNEQEQKVLKIEDWNKELDIFLTADINKADWRGQFNVTTKGDTTVYQTSNEKLFVNRLTVQRDSMNKVAEIKLYISRTNLIYSSFDTLVYQPRKAYSISKSQKIKLLDQRNYRVEGVFQP